MISPIPVNKHGFPHFTDETEKDPRTLNNVQGNIADK